MKNKNFFNFNLFYSYIIIVKNADNEHKIQ